MKNYLFLISIILFPCFAYSQCNYPHGIWDTTHSSMPTERSIFSVVNYKDSIFVLGGGIGNGSDSEYIKTVDLYVPANDTWETSVTELPFPMCSPNAFLIGHKIYVIGGLHFSNSAPIIYDSVQIYDIESNSWEKGTSLPTAVSVFGGDTINGKIYVAGGGTDNWGIVNMLYVYDPTLDEWTEKAPMNMTRRASSAKSWSGKLYVFGGYSGASWSVSNSIEVYDPEQDKWTMLSYAPERRTLMSMSMLKGQFLVSGGIDSYTNTSYNYSENMMRYNPSSDKWFSLNIEGDYMPEMRQFPVTAVVDDKFYLFGGYHDGTDYTNVWSYSLKSIEQTQLIKDTILSSEITEIDLSMYFTANTNEALSFNVCAGYNMELIEAAVENSILTITKKSNVNGSTELMVNAFSSEDTISSNSIVIEVEEQTSIGKVNQSQLSVYPNPASNKVIISTTQKEVGVAKIKIYNSIGKEVEQHKILTGGNFALDVAHYNNGCYFVVLETDKSTSVSKMVISR